MQQPERAQVRDLHRIAASRTQASIAYRARLCVCVCVRDLFQIADGVAAQEELDERGA